MTFQCVRVPEDPNNSSTLDCLSDDACGCNCNCGCGAIDDANSIGGARDSAGDSSSVYLRGTSPPGFPSYKRLGGEFKNISLADGTGGANFNAFGHGDGPNARLAYSNTMMVGSTLTDIQAGFGLNWSLNLSAKIYEKVTDTMLVFFLPGRFGEKYYFERQEDDTFLASCGSTAELVETSTEYWLIVDGAKTIFYKSSGYLKKMISSGGIETDFDYDSNGQLDEVITKRTEGSTHIRNSLLFAYKSSGGGGGPGGLGGASIMVGGPPILESITERSYIGTDSTPGDSDFTPQHRMLVDIPSSTSSNKYLDGSLHKIHMQTPTVSGGTTTWSTDKTTMYVYYTSSTSTSFSGALKYVIEPAGYASLANPDTASDALLKAASSEYFQYDSNQRVSRIETKGATQWSTITYTENGTTPTDEANNWALKSVYTSNDGSVLTVFGNHLGADMLVHQSDGTLEWITYNVFNSDGSLSEAYSPSSINMSGTPYDQSEVDQNDRRDRNGNRIRIRFGNRCPDSDHSRRRIRESQPDRQ